MGRWVSSTRSFAFLPVMHTLPRLCRLDVLICLAIIKSRKLDSLADEHTLHKEITLLILIYFVSTNNHLSLFFLKKYHNAKGNNVFLPLLFDNYLTPQPWNSLGRTRFRPNRRQCGS